MGRAILIDNFLSENDFSSITEKVVESEYWSNDTLGDYLRDDLWNYVTERVFARCGSIGLYDDRFLTDKQNTNFSYNQFRPANYHHNGNRGPHVDNGSYVFYIHPEWNEDWDGKLQLVNAENEEYKIGIYAKPNRFIWMNPSVVHDITPTSPNSTHARVTNLGFMNTCFDQNPTNCEYLNIFTTD